MLNDTLIRLPQELKIVYPITVIDEFDTLILANVRLQLRKKNNLIELNPQEDIKEKLLNILDNNFYTFGKFENALIRSLKSLIKIDDCIVNINRYGRFVDIIIHLDNETKLEVNIEREKVIERKDLRSENYNINLLHYSMV